MVADTENKNVRAPCSETPQARQYAHMAKKANKTSLGSLRATSCIQILLYLQQAVKCANTRISAYSS